MNGLFNAEDMGVAAMVMWAIWNCRNNLVWNVKKSNEAAILGSAVGTLQQCMPLAQVGTIPRVRLPRKGP